MSTSVIDIKEYTLANNILANDFNQELNPYNTSSDMTECKISLDHLQFISQPRIITHLGHRRNDFTFSYARHHNITDSLTEIHRTNVVPYAIQENWMLFIETNIPKESYNKIFQLAGKTDNWRGAGSKKLNGESLREYLKFWKKIYSFATEPDFSLMPNGNLQAEWFKNNTHFTEIEFQPNGTIFYGVFDGKTVHEGESKVNELVPLISSTVASKKRLQWQMV